MNKERVNELEPQIQKLIITMQVQGYQSKATPMSTMSPSEKFPFETEECAERLVSYEVYRRTVIA